MASDYYSLSAGPYTFYYGYEFDRDEEDNEIWGFEVTKDSKVIYRLPMEYDGRDTAEILLKCIGIWIESKYGK